MFTPSLLASTLKKLHSRWSDEILGKNDLGEIFIGEAITLNNFLGLSPQNTVLMVLILDGNSDHVAHV